MYRLVVALACLALAAGCKKDAEKQPAQPEASKQAAAEPSNEAAAEAEEAPAEDEKPMVITEDAVKRYLAYWEEELALSRAALEGIGKQAEKLDKEKGVVNGMQALGEVQEISEKAERDREALRKKHGLTESNIRDLQELIMEISTAQRLGKNSPVEMMKKGLEGLPPEQRAEMEKQIKEMETNFGDIANAKSAREKFGDAAVDAAFKHEAKIMELTDKTFGLLK